MADTTLRHKDVITIGSGIPYIKEYTGTMPEVSEICVEENRLGYIKSGCALEYTQEPYTEKDDLGYASKVVITTEEAILKLGLITWNGTVLQKLIDRCKVTEENGVRKIQIGGAGNAQGKEYVVCVHHIDKKDGDLWIMVRGNNTAGLTLTLSTEEGSLLEPEFTALPHDNNGTLVTIVEQTTATQA